MSDTYEIGKNLTPSELYVFNLLATIDELRNQLNELKRDKDLLIKANVTLQEQRDNLEEMIRETTDENH